MASHQNGERSVYRGKMKKTRFADKFAAKNQGEPDREPAANLPREPTANLREPAAHLAERSVQLSAHGRRRLPVGRILTPDRRRSFLTRSRLTPNCFSCNQYPPFRMEYSRRDFSAIHRIS